MVLCPPFPKIGWDTGPIIIPIFKLQKIRYTAYQAGVEIEDIHNKILTPELLLKDDKLIKIIDNDNYIKLLNDKRYHLISSPEGIRGISPEPTWDSFPVRDSDNLLPVDIQNDTNKQFWIKIKIPDDAKPGFYYGKILLKAPKEDWGEIKLVVKVLPITLLKPYLNYSIYYAARTVNATILSALEKSENQFRVEINDMLDHGITNPTIFPQDSGLGKILQIRNEVGIENQTIY